jgi:hypothetical protein
MNIRLFIASGICVVALTGLSLPVHAKTMKECAAQWREMKAANQTAGMKYRDFSKQCMSGGEAGTTPPPAAEKPASAPAATTAETKPAKPMSPGRQAMIARERACGAEWKADKAAGKIPAGQKWPQYWSECNKRKKAEGM